MNFALKFNYLNNLKLFINGIFYYTSKVIVHCITSLKQIFIGKSRNHFTVNSICHIINKKVNVFNCVIYESVATVVNLEVYSPKYITFIKVMHNLSHTHRTKRIMCQGNRNQEVVSPKL